MDDSTKNVTSFQSDQEILDARGINMTVEEVACLPTVRYSERVHSLNLNAEDMAFLKSLRRRIKNRLASQNSRRRNMEHLRKLTRELRSVRACKVDALMERDGLVRKRALLAERCKEIKLYLEEVLKTRSDPTPVPCIEIKTEKSIKMEPETDFECRIVLVNESVNHIYKEEKKEKANLIDIFRESGYVTEEKQPDQGCHVNSNSNIEGKDGGHFEKMADNKSDNCVLNLSVKNGRRHHGRKQSAPRRIAYAFSDYEDSALDLKIKKEGQ